MAQSLETLRSSKIKSIYGRELGIDKDGYLVGAPGLKQIDGRPHHDLHRHDDRPYGVARSSPPARAQGPVQSTCRRPCRACEKIISRISTSTGSHQFLSTPAGASIFSRPPAPRRTSSTWSAPAAASRTATCRATGRSGAARPAAGRSRRAPTRWFEVHRWEPAVPWFSPEYVQVPAQLQGPGLHRRPRPRDPEPRRLPDRPHRGEVLQLLHDLEPRADAGARDRRDRADAKRGAPIASTSLRGELDAGVPCTPRACRALPSSFEAELEKPDEDDVIGLWGVDMAAAEEYAYQRPGCQFFVLEAMRRGIGVYLPPESDLMRPMPVYGISEWDHNYIKLTSRARELNARRSACRQQQADARSRSPACRARCTRSRHFVQHLDEPVRDAARHGDPAGRGHRPGQRHHALRRPAGLAHDGGGAPPRARRCSRR
jgi:hypothetical protein